MMIEGDVVVVVVVVVVVENTVSTLSNTISTFQIHDSTISASGQETRKLC